MARDKAYREAVKRIEQARQEGATELDLRDMKLTEVPETIAQLTNLQLLSLANNRISSIPDSIAQLTNLQGLSLDNNRISSIPDSIAQLTNLQLLNLGNNQISSIPDSIAQLTNLQGLSLDNNRISSIPDSIAQLSNLQLLYLSDNQISSIPDSIAQLSNLQLLYLYNNQISIIPEAIAQLTNLQVLSLFANKISVIPETIAQLTNLQELSLGNNQISIIPEAIAQLTNLQVLDLFANKIGTIPESIAQLTNLQQLSLSFNQISSIPDSIAQLKQLKCFVLENNPLPIPPEVIRKGWGEKLEDDGDPKALLDYYFQTQRQRTRPLNEVKVLLVGEGDVGKTSLLKRLIEGCFNPDERKTEGINIQTWLLPVQGQEIRLNLWDFGGQEIMHATHQFFLTKRSIYLLVLDNRQSEQQNRLEYWLKMIQSFGGNSPIILVGNRLDEHALDLNQRALRKKYKTIRAIIGTSCQDGHGLEELRKTLIKQIDQLTHVRNPLPLPWFQLKTQLEQMQKDYDFISYERYQTLCAEAGIDKASDQKTLVQFLHDLGIVLNFQDDPRVQETNVLNPEWVTTGVYKILNNNALLTRHKGILERSQLPQILNDPQRYPDEKYGFLLNLMRKFELCFDLEGAIDSRFLIPDLLPKEEPETGDWSNAMRFEYHYTVLPSSIISRFIVRTSKLISRNTRWRTGVVLKQGINNRALIRADEEDRQITIWLTGSQPRTLLEIIRSNFDDIHDTIPNIEVEERLGLSDEDKLTVSYAHLLNLEAAGQTEFIPEGTRKKYNVRDLLNGIEDVEIRKDRRDRLEHRERHQAQLEAEREAGQTEPRRSSHPTLLGSSVPFLLALAVIAAIFAVLAHSVPGLSLLLVTLATLTAFGFVAVVVLLITGKIDNTTFSSALSGFWNALPLLRGDSSAESKDLPPNQPNDSSTPKL